GRQNLDRLAAYVAPMAAAKNLFEIERTFAVSQERLFQACTRAEDLMQWFAAPGMKVIKAEQDFRVGGIYHYGTASPQGQEMWGKVTYKEIKPNSRLVYLQSFSDKDGGITTHPMAPTWPMEMVTIFEFVPEGPKQTKLKISWIYAGVDDTEASTFHAAHEGMTGGWTGSLDALQNYLNKN
ncbi:MAG: SRPBCC domain-containing protein, partial [Aestuariivirga sp.]